MLRFYFLCFFHCVCLYTYSVPCVTLVVHGTKCVFVFVGFSGGVVGIICLCLFDCVLVHIFCAVCYAGRAWYKVCF